VALRATGTFLPAVASALALVASGYLGFVAPRRVALGVALLIGLVFLLIPLHAEPAPPEVGCDPFCAEDGESFLTGFGPFALLALPFLVIPTALGSAIRRRR
jgi:hypothetical protein